MQSLQFVALTVTEGMTACSGCEDGGTHGGERELLREGKTESETDKKGRDKKRKRGTETYLGSV